VVQGGRRMKKLLIIIPWILLLCITFGCQDKEAMAELEEFRTQAAFEEQNKELIKSFFEVVDSGDVDKMRDYYRSETVYYSPSGSSNPMTGDEDIELTKMFVEAFPDLSHNIEEIYAVDNKVIVRLMTEGTHVGELEGFPPPGNALKVSSIYIFTIKEGKIVEARADADMLGFYQQLGMELKPKEAKK
jgi:steroid delta-isomerase-like uncharacterized protein